MRSPKGEFPFEDHEHLLIEEAPENLDRTAAGETHGSEEIDESASGPADPADPADEG